MVQRVGKEVAKPPKKKQSSRQRPGPAKADDPPQEVPLDFSPLPITLQQILLNTFRSALFHKAPDHDSGTTEPQALHLKPLIQRVKTHLYNRNFDSAFTDADEDSLRAYALRWSAGRALGYAGLFRGVFELLPCRKRLECKRRRIVCIGGGGGAEIAALAAVYRDLADSRPSSRPEATRQLHTQISNGISVTTVDIADWAGILRMLDASIRGTDTVVTSLSSPFASLGAVAGEGSTYPPASLIRGTAGDDFRTGFVRANVLDLSEMQLKEIFGAFSSDVRYNDLSSSNGPQPLGLGSEPESGLEQTVLVTLMFTFNELITMSVAKSTALLLRLTDCLLPGTVLLVVDSPGSYSTLKLGQKNSEDMQERRYPMKFLLDHTLLSVASGKWERVYSQDSRWWRRDTAALRYEVGEGIGLEDMRYQVHIYRRVGN